MTKKDYIILAEAIRLATDSADHEYIHAYQLIADLVCKLRKENPRLDGFRFVEACMRK